ncbi:MAG: class I SAM-dependent methyltransferase [Thiotrichales bacterium]
MPPVARALIAQALAVFMALATTAAAEHWTDLAWSPWVTLALQGGLAASFGRQFGLQWWWLPINAILPGALIAAQRLSLAPEWYLLAFATLVIVYWTTFKTQVPLFLSNRTAVRAVAACLPPAPFRVLDLGSGIGSLVCQLSHHAPGGRYHGIENAPLPYLISKLRSLRSRGAIRITWGNFWNYTLEPYDCVYAFLSPVPMADLWRKVQREMRPGTLLISNTFAIPGVDPRNVVEVDDQRGTRLFVYEIGQSVSGS